MIVISPPLLSLFPRVVIEMVETKRSSYRAARRLVAGEGNQRVWVEGVLGFPWRKPDGETKGQGFGSPDQSLRGSVLVHCIAPGISDPSWRHAMKWLWDKSLLRIIL